MRVGSGRHGVMVASTLALLGCAFNEGEGAGADGATKGCEPPCVLGSTCKAGRCVTADPGYPSTDAGPSKADASDGSNFDIDAGQPLPDAGQPLPDAGQPLPDAGQPLPDAGCVGTSSTAERQPLDLYIMLDQSLSMADGTAAGVSKWTAVTQALSSFLSQPGMDGTSVGLQYMPLASSGNSCSFTGATCSTQSDCGGCSMCSLSRCIESAGADSCSPAAYADPAVEISPIAESASKIRDSIAARSPRGFTPTFAALLGAINHARSWAAVPAHSQHQIAVVLATDGEPTECDTNLDNICAIAQEGAKASPPIRTYIIGVGLSRQKLDRIASCGDTKSALIVETGSDVNAQFLAALNEIRGNAIGCTYLIPAPPGSQLIDFDEVNVQYTPGPGASPATFMQVSDAMSCASKTDAWHYDDLNAPKQIILCPETCKRAEGTAGGQVSIVLGCKTVGPN